MLKKVAAIWRFREKIEWEAAHVFATLATSLHALELHDALPSMAEKAAADEREHAGLCRTLVETFAPEMSPLPPNRQLMIGPDETLSTADQALYTSVALGCITETLSAALLLNMRECVEHPTVRGTVDQIVQDEILHSRLGWAHLAAVAEREDPRWLAPHIAAMLHEALRDDVVPMTVETTATDLSAYGILPRSRVRDLVHETLETVILPGFAEFGFDAHALRKSGVQA